MANMHPLFSHRGKKSDRKICFLYSTKRNLTHSLQCFLLSIHERKEKEIRERFFVHTFVLINCFKSARKIMEEKNSIKKQFFEVNLFYVMNVQRKGVILEDISLTTFHNWVVRRYYHLIAKFSSVLWHRSRTRVNLVFLCHHHLRFNLTLTLKSRLWQRLLQFFLRHHHTSHPRVHIKFNIIFTNVLFLLHS